MKRFSFTAFLLALLISCSLVTAYASGSSPESTKRADTLKSLSLFQGTDKGYQLDSTPTRMQGLVMLIRLLGLEDEALAYGEPSPFTDLSWGESYAAYAYDNGITQGTSATTFSPDDTLDAKSYVTFLLRSLGYDDKAGDFTWDKALTFSAAKGLMTAESAGKLTTITMNRGDMVDLSYAALFQPLKNTTTSLAADLCQRGVFSRESGTAAGVLGNVSGWVYSYTPYDTSTITYREQHMAGVTAHVLTVNPENSRVEIKTALVDNTIGATDSFQNIVKSSGAAAVVNGNFFASYDPWKAPIGHVMTNGQMVFGNSGISSLGIYSDGSVAIGRPGIFTRLTAGNGNTWAIYEVNTLGQGPDTSVLYTPAYGKSFTMKVDGSVLSVAGGVITSFRSAAAGTEITIPAGGYVAFMGSNFTKTDYFRTPTTGDTITRSYYITNDNGEEFDTSGLVSMVSGAPRLVKDGAIVTTLEAGFDSDTRFTTGVSPRTAVGINKDGKLLLVSVPGGATIQQMRELMLGLGCMDAFNLDGGASCGMYYNGQYLATPGRELTVTLQIFVVE